MDLNSNFWAGVSGAIVGAVVGGIISYLLQRQSLSEARRQRKAESVQDEERRKADDTRVQRALGTSLLFKVISIEANLDALYRYFGESYENARNNQLEGNPWTYFQPLANHPEPIYFSPNEMGMLLGLRDDALFNEMLILDRDHNHLVAQSVLLSTILRTIASQARVERVDGEVLVSRYPLEAVPRQVEADSLVRQMHSDLKLRAPASRNTLSRLHQLLRTRVGIEFQLRFKN